MSDLQDELERLRIAHARLQDRHQALLRRRGVRLALWAAGLLARTRKRPPTEPVAPVAADSDRPAAARPRLLDVELLASAPPVSIVIPILGDAPGLDDCLSAVVEHTSSAIEVVIVDDASTSERVIESLGRLSGLDGVRVMRNDRRLGFWETTMRFVSGVPGDVILLDPSIVVPPRWVERLRIAAYSDGLAASAAPVCGSNPESAMSDVADGQPGGWQVADVARAVARGVVGSAVVVPTVNTLCCYLKRSAILDVGFSAVTEQALDDTGWSRWADQATANGWLHLVTGELWVARGEHAGARGTDVREIAEVERRARAAVDRPKPRPRALTVIHDLGGGTEHSSRDLALALEPDIEMFVARCSPHRIEVYDGRGTRLERFLIEPTLRIQDTDHPNWSRAFGDLLCGYDIEILHVRQSMNTPPGMFGLARVLGLPLVISLHDFYLVCPTAHLIDESGSYCGGACTAGQGRCPAVPWVEAGPHLKHAWIDEWQRRSREILGAADVVVAASESTVAIHREALGRPVGSPVFIIPHGRDVERSEPVIVRPEPNEPLRVLMAGSIGLHKGNDVVRRILALAPPGSLEFHVLGTFPGEGQDGVIVHGKYSRDDFGRLVGDIRPHVAALLSITPETWSHFVTEAWSVGLPVVVTDLGAPAERLGAQGGGWIVPPSDPGGTLRLLLGIRAGEEDFDTKVAEAVRARWDDLATMSVAYHAAYRAALARHRTVS